MIRLNTTIIALPIIFSMIMLPGCSDSKESNSTSSDIKKSTSQIFTVKEEQTNKVLYFNSTVEPGNLINVSAASDGIIAEKFFHHGQFVKKGSKLYRISADNLDDNYRSAFSKYLKAKQDHENILHWMESSDVLQAKQNVIKAENSLASAKNTYNTDQELYEKFGVISKEKLHDSKTAYQNAQFSLQQAKVNLDSTVRKGTGTSKEISLLAFKNAESQYQKLKDQRDHLLIIAPASGVTLHPKEKSDAKNLGNLGSEVKHDQVLVSIGDLRSLTLNLQIDELNIDIIKSGQPIIVTSIAFPGVELKGKVIEVDEQASNTGGGVPTFNAIAKVLTIPDKIHRKILVGMTAKVQMNIQSPKRIFIPIHAVFVKDGKNMVKRINPETGLPENVEINAGETTRSMVSILQGLSAGDKIVLNH